MSIYNNIKFLTGAISGSGGNERTSEPIMGAFRSKIDWAGNTGGPITLFSIDVPRTPPNLNIFSYPYNTLFIKCITLREQSPSNSTGFPVATTGWEGWFNISNPYEPNPLLPDAIPPGNYEYSTPSSAVFSQLPTVGFNYTDPVNGVQLTGANSPINQPNITIDNIQQNRIIVKTNSISFTLSYDPFFIKGQYLLV